MTNVPVKLAAMYRNVANETRADLNDQHELVAVLFDGLVQSLQRARGAMAQEETVEKVRSINQAIRILQEGLLVNLDLERGGDLAKNLASLYEYLIHQLMISNVRNDLGVLDKALELVGPLGEAWRKIGRSSSGAHSKSAVRPLPIPDTGKRFNAGILQQSTLYAGV